MGARIDKLYGEYNERKNHVEIDKLVAIYQDKNSNSIKKTEVMAELLKCFHNYFIKYVRLLRGELNFANECVHNSDTMEFLALFTSAEEKKKSQNWYIKTCQNLKYICSDLDEEDIYNEECVIFITLLNKYKVYEGTSFTRYLTKHMRWAIQQWILKMARTIEKKNKISFDSAKMCAETYELEYNEVDLPELNIKWILEPNSKLFDILSPYERFLLFLKYKHNQGVRITGKSLGRTRNTINEHIAEAMRKLRKRIY